jgi:hypothetical protein
MVVAALAVGRWVLSRLGSGEPHPVLAALLGLLIIWVIGIVPFVGWLAGFAATLFGMGAILLALYARPATPSSGVMMPPQQSAYPTMPPAAPPAPPPAVPPSESPPPPRSIP